MFQQLHHKCLESDGRPVFHLSDWRLMDRGGGGGGGGWMSVGRWQPERRENNQRPAAPIGCPAATRAGQNIRPRDWLVAKSRRSASQTLQHVHLLILLGFIINRSSLKWKSGNDTYSLYLTKPLETSKPQNLFELYAYIFVFVIVKINSFTYLYISVWNNDIINVFSNTRYFKKRLNSNNNSRFFCQQ